MQYAGGLRNPEMGLGRRSVGFPTNRAKAERAERRAMIALVAVFALLVQALIPAMASAAPVADGALTICTQMGLQAAPAGDALPADHACQHCLCPAAVSGPPPVVTVERVVHARAASPAAPKSHWVSPPARAPPRPPGQGPPSASA